MARTRSLTKALSFFFLLAALFAPGALGAEGVGPAKSLGGGGTTASATTSGTVKTNGSSKEVLSVSTVRPTTGATLSGAVGWEVAISAGSPSRVEFLVDGGARFSDASAPYGGSLDTTTLANGNHTLSATAYGSKGVKATTSVTVTVSNAVAPAPEPSPEPAPAPIEPGTGAPIYWGAAIGDQLTGTPAPWDMNAVTKFQQLTGQTLSLVHFFQPFSTCSGATCSYYSFPWTPLENVRQNGSIPVVSWNSQSIPSSVNEPDYQLSDVIAGRHDAYIREWATKAKAWGHPFFLRFNWEMNGDWFPWGEGVNGNKPGEFAAAWRHVHDIFAAVGANNVTWVWCPNISWNGSLENFKAVSSSQYPGDAYVDWTGLDGYNWGTNPSHSGSWQTFNQLYRASYRHLVESVAPTKPMMIGEVASSEYGGSKATWIKEMLAQVPSEYPKIRALLWFDKYDSSMDWPIETSSAAVNAFAEGVRNSAYVGGTFGNLSATTIQPLA